jgi:hypothetical protein
MLQCLDSGKVDGRMKKIFYGFFLLVLVGCGPTTYTEVVQQASRSGYNYTALAEPRSWIGQNQGGYGASKVSQEHANNLAMSFCQNNYRDCVFTYEGNNWVLDKKEEKIKNQKVDNTDELKIEKNLRVKEKELTIIQLETLYSETCGRKNKKDSDKYNNCLLEKQTEAKQIAEKLVKMSPDDRRAYNCTEKFGFRKGSDKFKDCIFELYKVESELEKLELQKKVAQANLEAAKAKETASRSEQDRAIALLQRQTSAQELSAAAALQQARIADFESNQRLFDRGMELLSGDRNLAGQVRQPQQRLKTNCTFNGRFMNCY